MAFFDLFLSEEGKIQKNRQRLISRDTQAEDRETAARWLAENGSPKALVALLSRFDMRLDHQLHDKEEKEFTYALLADVGEPVVKPLRTWLKKCKTVNLPLKLYEELTDRDRAITAAYKLLEAERIRDDFKPLKKNALLVWLSDQKDDGVLAAAEPFLTDFDEEVRCSAALVIISQGDAAAAPMLEAALVNADEDSRRLRHRIAEGFASRGWPIADEAAVAAVLTDGYAVRDGRIVRA